MKKLFSLSALLLAATLAHGQQFMRIWHEGSNERVALTDMEYSSDGKTITANGKQYTVSTVDSITMVHVITVDYSTSGAVVDMGKAPDVSVTTDGGHVSITSTNTKQELELVLKGTCPDGSLTYTGNYKCKLYLDGLNLTSKRGAAIDIQCGKRIDLILNEGTSNFLSDAAGGLQKAALYCKGHLEVEGSGSLTVEGNAAHAIATKEYLQLKKSTGSITVTKAAKDAMHVGQYFLMSGGKVTISGQASDGIQVETLTLEDGTADPEKENNGKVMIRGGILDIKVTGATCKGIKSPDDMTVNGGDFTIVASGDGTKGISVSGNLLVNEDNATTLMKITASGKTYTDDVTDEDTRCMGIKIAKDFTITAGTINVKVSSATVQRGIKIDGTYTKTGTAVVNANIKN